MKIPVIILVAILALLTISAPALAASMGVSPSKVEVEIPADGSQTIPMRIYHYTGEVQISLVDIPLKVTPETVQVDADENPQEIQVTIYGDPSLVSQVYDGYIRLLGKTGEMVAVALQVKAKVTIIAAQPLPTDPEPEAGTLAENTEGNQELVASTSPEPPPAGEVAETNWLDGIEGLSTNLVIIIAAGVVFLGLVILAISLSRRKRGYY